jgi:hypothetical protein
MQDLFSGQQGYRGLKRRLYQNLNRSLREILVSFLSTDIRSRRALSKRQTVD